MVSQNININTVREKNIRTDILGIPDVREQSVQNVLDPNQLRTQCNTVPVRNLNIQSKQHLLNRELSSFLSCYGVAIVVKNGGSTVRDSVCMDDSEVLER